MLSARGIMWVTGKGNGAAHGGGSGGGSSLTVEMIAVSMKVSGTTARRQEGGVTLVEGWKRKTVSVSTVGWKQTVGWKRGESSGKPLSPSMGGVSPDTSHGDKRTEDREAT